MSSLASQTNVFHANNRLRGAGYTLEGVRALSFRGDSTLLLGTNAIASELAIAVQDLECWDQGIRPAISLVALNRSTQKIASTLVRFEEITTLYSGDDRLLMHARGVGGDGVAGADLDAMITFEYEPCVLTNTATVPVRVTIEPLGTLKPAMTPPFQAPITRDAGLVLIHSDDPDSPLLAVNVQGAGALPSPTCNIDVSPGLINFGTVAVGSNETRTLVIRNNGALSCTVTGLTRNGSSAFAVVGPGLPAVLPAGGAIAVNVTFTPVLNGIDSAVVRVAGTDPADPLQYVTLTGTGSATSPCNINASPLALAFGSVQIGTNRTLDVTVANTGSSTCLVDAVTLVTASTNFVVNTPAVPFTVAPNTSEVIRVTYIASPGDGSQGTLEIDNDDPDNRLILVSLSATSVTATCNLTFGPTELDFGAVVVGTNRQASVTVSNTSLAACTINSITGLSGDFALDPGVVTPLNLAPGETTSLGFVFTASGGLVTNDVTVNWGAANNTNIRLVGLGVAIAPDCNMLFSRSSIDFGDIATGSSEVQKFQISNTSATNCTIRSVQITGSADFTLISPPRPIVLKAFDIVEIGVRYSPGTNGSDIGLVQVATDDAVEPVVEIPLTGNGVRALPVLNTNLLAFGSIPVGTSRSETAFLANTNGVNLVVNSIVRSGSGDFILDPIVPTSRFVLAPGESVELPVTYLPSNIGADSGTVTVQTDGGPVTLNLSGTGLQPNLTVSPASLDLGQIILGQTNTLPVTLTNSGNTNSLVSAVEVVGSGQFFIASPVAPFTVAPGAPLQLQIGYLPINVQTLVISGGSIKTSGNPLTVTP